MGFVQKLLQTANVTALIHIIAIDAINLLLHLDLLFQLHLLRCMPSFDGDRDFWSFFSIFPLLLEWDAWEVLHHILCMELRFTSLFLFEFFPYNFKMSLATFPERHFCFTFLEKGKWVLRNAFLVRISIHKPSTLRIIRLECLLALATG